MSKSIEKIAFFFVLSLGIFISSSQFSYAQFYVSPKACVSGTPSTPTGGGCDLATSFFDRDATATAWSWDFGDGIGSAFTRSASYQYASAGTYVVSLTQTTPSGTTTLQRTLVVGTTPSEPLFNKKATTDTTVCSGSDVKLDPYAHQLGISPSNVSYRWFPGGETTPTINVTKSGCYSVEVIDNTTGCSSTASIKVKFCLQPTQSGGGGEKWYFGRGAALDFALNGTWESDRDSLATDGGVFANDSTLTNPSIGTAPAGNASPVNTTGSTAMVYGPEGDLKFYTDGKSIFNRLDQPLKDLSGNPVQLGFEPTSQGLSIVPKPSCNECPHHQYYVFGVDKTTKTITYGIIDMRYNNKEGALIEQNIPLYYPVNERLTAVPKTDSTGFILVAHEAQTNTFTFITVDSSGVRTTQQSVGLPHSDPASQSGYIAVAPNGKYLAIGVVNAGKNYVEFYDFDRESLFLTLKETIEIAPAPPTIYGVAFANNSDILYVTLQGDPAAGIASQLYQVPLFLGNSTPFVTLIDQSTVYRFGAIQLGPVNAGISGLSKPIFVAIEGVNEIPYIQSPDLRGNAAVIGYTRIAATEGAEITGLSQLGLPNVVYANQEQDGDGVQATYSGNCFNSPTILEVQDVCSPLTNKIEWILEGGGTSKDKQFSYKFPKVGWNKIQLKITTFSPTKASQLAAKVSPTLAKQLEQQCKDTTIVDSIYIKASPKFSLPDSLYICNKDTPPTFAKFDPNPTGGSSFTYLWMTDQDVTLSGTTTATDELEIRVRGKYRLEIENNLGCKTKEDFKAVEGCLPRLFAPNSFTPNGDSINDTFEVKYAHIKNYHLTVYNRWGETIFESKEPDIRWSGKVNGKAAPVGVYAYLVTYESEDFPDKGIIKERGTITVLR